MLHFPLKNKGEFFFQHLSNNQVFAWGNRGLILMWRVERALKGEEYHWTRGEIEKKKKGKRSRRRRGGDFVCQAVIQRDGGKMNFDEAVPEMHLGTQRFCCEHYEIDLAATREYFSGGIAKLSKSSVYSLQQDSVNARSAMPRSGKLADGS